MNSLISLAAISGSSSDLKGLLISFIIAVLVLAAIGGLIWCIERWISPIPAPGKTVIAIVLVAILIIWAITVFL